MPKKPEPETPPMPSVTEDLERLRKRRNLMFDTPVATLPEPVVAREAGDQ